MGTAARPPLPPARRGSRPSERPRAAAGRAPSRPSRCGARWRRSRSASPGWPGWPRCEGFERVTPHTASTAGPSPICPARSTGLVVGRADDSPGGFEPGPTLRVAQARRHRRVDLVHDRAPARTVRGAGPIPPHFGVTTCSPRCSSADWLRGLVSAGSSLRGESPSCPNGGRARSGRRTRRRRSLDDSPGAIRLRRVWTASRRRPQVAVPADAYASCPRPQHRRAIDTEIAGMSLARSGWWPAHQLAKRFGRRRLPPTAVA